jgi:hypothetical protein
MRTIFCMQVFVAWAPFIDGSRVETHALGCYTSLDAALAWIQGSDFREQFDPNDAVERPLVVQVVEKALDSGAQGYRGHVTISLAGKILERQCADVGFWRGRDPSSCRWQRGDIVACIGRGRYRIGVVLALPHSIEWVRQQPRPGITPMDDVYLVGFADDELDHDHPSEAMMFEPLAEVPEDLLLRLRERAGKYPTVP